MVVGLYTHQMDGYKRIVLYLNIKQKGLCHLCSQRITKLSPIVKKQGKPSRYYHVACAKKINLL